MNQRKQIETSSVDDRRVCLTPATRFEIHTHDANVTQFTLVELEWGPRYKQVYK